MLSLFLTKPFCYADTTEPKSTAIFYASQPPVELLGQYQRVVVEPDNITAQELAALHAKGAKVFAYLSIGEVNSTRKWYKQVDPDWILGRNNVWDSEVMDLAKPGWQNFVIKQLVAPLADKGYDGLFLDTMDSFHIYATNQAARDRQAQALASLLQTIRKTYPNIHLIANRGFEVMSTVAPQLEAVAAESLFASWDNARKTFRTVKLEDTKWLMEKLTSLKRDYGLDIIVIDYLPIAHREDARTLAKKIQDLGFVPWVTKPELDGMGVGLIEPKPQEALVVFDSKLQGQQPLNLPMYQQLQDTLQKQGLQVKMHDIQLGVPREVVVGRYASIYMGIPEEQQTAASKAWFKSLQAEGITAVVVNKEKFDEPTQ